VVLFELTFSQVANVCSYSIVGIVDVQVLVKDETSPTTMTEANFGIKFWDELRYQN
jgi:hypothetical protein